MNFIRLPEPVCAAIGNFDGVHLGHQKLIEESKRHNIASAVLTFYPHPSVFLKKIAYGNLASSQTCWRFERILFS